VCGEPAQCFWRFGAAGLGSLQHRDGLAASRYDHHQPSQKRALLCGKAADVPQRHLLRHAAEVEDPQGYSELRRVTPALDNVDAALWLPRNHFALRDLLRDLEPSRCGTLRVP
jgi:hypothetical protein